MNAFLFSIVIAVFSIFSLQGVQPSSSQSVIPQKKSVEPTTKPKSSSSTKLIMAPSSSKEHSPQTKKEREDLFFYPGMITLKNGAWLGSDNLNNFGRDITVQANIIKPQTDSIPITKERLEEKLNEVLEKGGMTVLSQVAEGKPPLPLFHLLVMIYPTQEGYASVLVGRLFEQVDLRRIKPEDGQAYQAITWEQANLVVAKRQDFEKLFFHAVETLGQNFLKRASAEVQKGF